MCITHQSDSHDSCSEMIVGGALGFDGKPVRIKVELPVNLQSMFKNDRKKRRRTTVRTGDGRMKRKDENAMEIIGQATEDNCVDKNKEANFDSISSDDGDDDDILDLPDSFRKYMFKKALRQRNSSKSSKSMSGMFQGDYLESTLGLSRSSRKLRNSARSVTKSNLFSDWSVSDFTTSSLSSLSSKVDSEEFLKYLENGDSTDDFMSDEYSFTSQLDIVEGENVSKPNKKNKSSRAALQVGRPSSFDSSIKLHYSSDNRTQSSLTKTQSKVLNDQGMVIDVRRSRSFPDPKSDHSSSTHLPLIKGVNSTQSHSRYSARRLPPGKLSNNTMLPANPSDEIGSLNVVQGRSFHGMVSKVNSFVSKEDSPEHKANGDLSKDKTKRVNSAAMMTRDSKRKQGQSDAVSQNVDSSELHLPNIFDVSASMNPTIAPIQHGTNVRLQERLHGQNPQSVHLPRLSVDGGIIAQQEVDGNNASPHYHGGGVTLRRGMSTDIEGSYQTESPMSVTESLVHNYQDGSEPYSIDMDTTRKDINDSCAQFTDTSHSKHIVSSAGGSRRGSIHTPTFPADVSKKRRPSRVSQAVVKEDVEISVARTNKNRGVRPPPRQKMKRPEEMPLLKKLSENNLNKTLSSQLPEKPDLTRRQSMEMKSFHAEDNIPRRIGHRLVKKKKGDDHLRDSIMHNSKDIGNIVEGAEAANNGSVAANPSSSMTRQPSAFLSIEEGSNSISQSPLSTSLRANKDLSTNFGYNSVVNMATGPGVRSRPASGGMGSKMSSNYPQSSSLLQQENKDSPAPLLPPVRLKPLDPSQIVNVELASSSDIQQPLLIPALGAQEPQEDGDKVSVNLSAPAEGEKKVEDEAGLEAIMEESEPESDDDEEYFDIRPIPELKPVSTLSFSSNVFSYFPMGRAHKQAYQAVRQKAVGPAPSKKWGRSHRTPAKAKRRKRG